MADFEVIFVDISEGDSTLVRLPGDSWVLIDVFRCEDHGIDLFKLMDDRLPTGEDGKPRLDLLIITHAHDDHIRGLQDLVERFDVQEIWAPRYETDKSLGDKFEEFKKVMQDHDNVVVQKGCRTPIAQLGENDEVTVRCFSPPGYIDIGEDLTDEQQRAEVHKFCGVYKFSYAGVSVMFAGDSDLSCWDRIIGYYEDVPDENDIGVIDSTVLHASHHGSRTFIKDHKDDEPWLRGLEVIDPEVVIVSVGANNKHKQPHDDVMKAYRDHVGDDDDVRETQHQGTITLEVEEDGAYDLRPDNDEYEDNYGWDDDDGGDDGSGGRSSGGGGTSAYKRSKNKTRTRLDNSSAA
ncbi:MAG TPA: MBL fold metallo-hydrolase [Solirubrobacteraceae bacterium]|nr:MBL fold metallo-hydrolase [Solirubrobacteraceae bacterium]